jgi:hypothetical protein
MRRDSSQPAVEAVQPRSAHGDSQQVVRWHPDRVHDSEGRQVMATPRADDGFYGGYDFREINGIYQRRPRSGGAWKSLVITDLPIERDEEGRTYRSRSEGKLAPPPTRKFSWQ